MKKIILFSICSSFLILFIFNTSYASDQQPVTGRWKAGVARVVITPEESIWMAGYGSRDHPSEGTLVDLWAKALVFEDTCGEQAVLITTDLESFPKETSDRIRDRIEAKFHLSRAQIILNSSHTHSGPVLQGMYNIYTEDPQQLKKIKQYTNKLEDQIVTLVGEALHSMVPVQLYVQNGITRFQVNRRNNNESNLSPQTELNGPNDYAVPVIKVINDAGDLIAVAFGYACHNTVLSIYKWSGDYAGFAQIELEKLHPGITALFFQGAGGDQNPLPRRTVALAQQYGRELAAAVERVLNEDMRELPSGLSTAYSEVELSLTSPPTKEELLVVEEESSGFEKQWATNQLDRIHKGEALRTSYPYPVQVWQLGGLPIISLGGELVIDYTIELKRIFGQEIFVLGYCNDVMAYIPSTRILREGGYEGASSQIAFGLPNTWAADIEIVIIKEVMKLAKQTGVTLPESRIIEK